MHRIILHSRVGADGILQITVPVGPADADRYVTVTIEPVGSPPMTQDAWRNFILTTAGSVSDPSFVRHEQGEYERRGGLP
jgi:hypothetical protein